MMPSTIPATSTIAPIASIGRHILWATSDIRRPSLAGVAFAGYPATLSPLPIAVVVISLTSLGIDQGRQVVPHRSDAQPQRIENRRESKDHAGEDRADPEDQRREQPRRGARGFAHVERVGREHDARDQARIRTSSPVAARAVETIAWRGCGVGTRLSLIPPWSVGSHLAPRSGARMEGGEVAEDSAP